MPNYYAVFKNLAGESRFFKPKQLPSLLETEAVLLRN